MGNYYPNSCSQADVNDCINGTGVNTCHSGSPTGPQATHTAVNGDVITIPAGSCTWTSGITISGRGISITGTGTPNTGPSTFGAGTSNTTLTDNAAAPLFTFTNLSYGQLAKVELLQLTGAGANNSILPAPLSFSGTCTSSGCANIRVDNINFTAGTWGAPAVDGSYIAEDNVFGVVDHNTVNDSVFPGGGAGPPLLDTSNNAWQGVGGNGDNSFATADTFGTAQVLYVENNSLNGIRINDNDVPPTGGGAGGARLVCRFNVITNMNGSGACGAAHGTAWGGRFRGQRQLEAYYNQATCKASTACDTAFSIPSGTGYVFSNTLAATAGFGMNASLALSLYRTEGLGASPWNNCDGTQPWDQVPWNSTSECLDQPGSGAGVLYTNQNPPTLNSAPSTACTTAGQCWAQNVLDPVYQAGDTGSNINAAVATSDPTRLAGYYYAAVSETAQTSATSPFNGTTGTGYGTLARRPTTCTPRVGYWATDQGTWNNGGPGGVLYICNTTNTWTTQYTPYTYPHPLTVVGGVTTLSPSSANFGSVTVGSTSLNITFTLTNNSAVTVTGISISNVGGNTTSFVQQYTTCSTTLAASASCIIAIEFAPQIIGNLSTTLTVTDSDSTSPQTAALSGTGLIESYAFPGGSSFTLNTPNTWKITRY